MMVKSGHSLDSTSITIDTSENPAEVSTRTSVSSEIVFETSSFRLIAPAQFGWGLSQLNEALAFHAELSLTLFMES